MSKIQPGGFILFGRNVSSAQQVRSLTDRLRDICNIEPIIAIDQEGGRVTRTKDIGNTPPSAEQLRSCGKPDLIAWHGIQTGMILNQLGINMNLAPVLDICYHPDTDNALRDRCFGMDAQEVINNAGIFNRNLIRTKVHGCGKHFPSCSLAKVDPHHKLPTSDKTLKELMQSDILPYTALGDELSAILSGHTHFSQLDPESPGLPASLSRNIITNLLRNQLGYEGVIITDDLDMGAIINTYGRGVDIKMAIEAGNDMAMICHQTDTAEKALESLQQLSNHTIEDSLQRIHKLKKNLPKTIAFDSDRWNKLNDEVMDLRIETLGIEAAENQHQSSSDSRSPVEDY